MPFRSEAQRRLMWAKHPKIARRWADKYGTPEDLPMHVSADDPGIKALATPRRKRGKK